MTVKKVLMKNCNYRTMDASKNQDLFANQRKIKVNDIDINFLKIGHGPQTLLCLHGILGFIGDFKLPVENLDLQKYTIVVWDAPGCGKSRPPDRDVSPGLFHRDADLAIALMDTLGVEKYSVLGWCGGGITALILASKAVDRVEKLVVWSCNAYVSVKDMDIYDSVRDVRSWNAFKRKFALETYGEAYTMEKWNGWIDSNRLILDERDGNVCCDVLSKIVAPTLIMHGARDRLIPVEHAVYLHEHINDSVLEIFPDGGHFLYGERFYSNIDNFLTENVKQ